MVESGHSTFLLTDEGIALIKRHDGNKPFFLYPLERPSWGWSPKDMVIIKTRFSG